MPDTLFRACRSTSFIEASCWAAARTGGFRQDLLDREVGDGRHGFIFHLPPGLIDDVSPSDIDVIAAFPAAVRLTVLDKPSIGQQTEAHDGVDTHQSSASFFLPLIARLTNVPLPESIPTLVVAERRRIDRLFDPVGPSGWSHIADHLAIKHGQPRPSDDPRAFWRWYLNSYAAFKPSLHAPLSGRDIEQLRALLDTSSTCDEGLEIATLDPALRPEFAWAALESRRLGIADCAISEATRAGLSEVPWFARQRAFPLSRFMRDLKDNHRILRPLRTHTSAQRQLVYALVMLFGVGEPHYLQYMPRRWLSRMLEDGGIRFETAQARHFGGAYLPTTRFEASVSRSGFDLVAGRYSGARYAGHRVQAARRSSMALPSMSSSSDRFDAASASPKAAGAWQPRCLAPATACISSITTLAFRRRPQSRRSALAERGPRALRFCT
jgi:hypothetical protein